MCLCLFKKKTTRTTKEEWKLTLSKCHMHKMMMRCGFLKIRWQIGHYSQFAITPFEPMLFELYFHTSFSCTVILSIKIRFDWGFFSAHAAVKCNKVRCTKISFNIEVVFHYKYTCRCGIYTFSFNHFHYLMMKRSSFVIFSL